MPHRSVCGALSGRGFVLFPACAYAVHQLRYELAYGSHASAALAAQGHGYLDSLAPWVALMVALGFGAFIMRLARSAVGREPRRRRRSFASLWCVCWLCLVATYAIQEWLEGIFAAGHPGGIEGIFGHGGLWAIPLAALAALLVASLLRIAAALVEAVALAGSLRRARVPQRSSRRPSSAVPVRRLPLAHRSAGRAPPVAGRAAFA